MSTATKATPERGKELFAQLRDEIETDENIGRIVAIDVRTGAYEIADEILAAADRLRDRHPDAQVWGERIGYDAVYAIGGTLTRTSQ
jgi:hypothetical protein